MMVNFTDKDLTKSAVREIITISKASDRISFKPVFQVISVRDLPVKKPTDTERFRAVLSDGEFFIQGMLPGHLKQHTLDSNGNQIRDNSIIRLKDFMRNEVNGRNLVIILAIEHLGVAQDRLGNPSDVETSSLQTASLSYNGGGANAVSPMYNRTNHPQGGGYSSPSKVPNPYSSTPSPRNPYSPSKAGSRSNGPIVHRGAANTPGGTPFTLIANLNLYQNRCVLKARVVNKSEMRTFSSAKAEGVLFKIDLLDSSGMDIQATFWKEAAEKFFNLLAVDHVYTISGAKVKVANMKFNKCKSQYELTIDQNAEIHLVNDDGEISSQSFDFVKIGDLERMEDGKSVDVLGVVQDIGEVQSLTSKKTGKELQKVDLTLIDDTGVQVRLTLWNLQALNASKEIGLHKVVAIKRARITDYNGKSLSGGDGSFVEPKIPEVEDLKRWWSSQGSRAAPVKSLSTFGVGGSMATFAERKTISDIKNRNLGYNTEKGDYISFKAHFTFLKKDKEGGAWYTACPNKEDPCNNRCKVTETTDGNWQCDRCGGTYPNCNRKWIFSGTVADDTASTWVSLFDDQGKVLLGGVTADEVFAQFDNQDAYDSHFAKALFTEWVFKCRVKSEIVNDEPRLKTTVVRMDPVDYVAESKELLAAIAKFQ